MSSILEILSSKPHNPHFLNRYIIFIQKCIEKNDNIVIFENHHICPKSKDMFPQYASGKKHPWNIAKLTPRQHYIAHKLLFKIYRNRSQAFSYRAMANGQSNQHQHRTKSRNYESAKLETRPIISECRKGIALYVDKDGNKIRCRTDDPLVLSGDLVSETLGRKHTKNGKSQKQIEMGKRYRKERWKDKEVSLYFLDIKIKVHATFGMPEIIPFLDQGWQLSETREHRSAISKRVNKEMPASSRKRAIETRTTTLQRKSKEKLHSGDDIISGNVSITFPHE